MLKFCQEHKGSISIILLIVISAMLIFSFMTFDIAKISLATAVAKNNTDLAGNAALTDYERILKDAYGLLANSKDLDELSKNVSDYYIATMSSNGVEFEQSSEVRKLIRSLLENADTDNNNMLQLIESEISVPVGENTYSGSVIIQPINESAISNPAVMKRQIVEFMKFRAPINLAMGVLEKLNVLSDLSNQSTAMSNKIAYEDALNRVQNSSDQVYEIYNAYRNNINIVKTRFPKTSSTNGKYNFIEYGACMENKISGYINKEYGDGLEAVNDCYNELSAAFTFLLPVKDYIDYSGNINKSISITAASPNDLSDMNGFVNAIENSGSFTSKIYRYLEDLDVNYDIEYDDPDILYDVLIASQPLYKCSGENTDEEYGGKSLSENFGYFYYTFYKLYYDYKAEYEDLKEEQKNLYKDTYNACNEIDLVLSRTLGRPKITFFTFTPPEHDAPSDGCVPVLVRNLYNDANTKLKNFNTCISEVGSYAFFQWQMAEFMSGSESPLDDLQEEINTALSASKTWDESINKVQTADYNASMRANYEVESYAFKDLDSSDISNVKSMFSQQADKYKSISDNLYSLYAVLGSTSGTLFDFLGNSNGAYNITGMPNARFLINHKDNCHLLLENAEGLKRSDTECVSNKSYDERVAERKPENKNRSVINSVDSDINTANTYINDLDSASSKEIYEVVLQISEKNIIKYTRTEDGTIEKNKDSEDSKSIISEDKKEEAEANRNAIAKVSGTDGSSDDEEDETTPEKNESTDDMSDVTKVTLYSEYIKENATLEITIGEDKEETENGLRNENGDGGGYDVGNMNADNEGNFNFDGVQNILSNVGSTFSGILEAGRDNLFVAEYITSSFTCLTTGLPEKDGKPVEEKSLTGYVFSKENNKHYQAELEYILYGCNSELANKAIAIASISGIRFVLNLIYSFFDGEITRFTDTTANTLGAAVPFTIPIIKTVLHIMLATAETAWDMLQLCQGHAVPLYKSTNTWVCKASNIIENVKNEVEAKVKDVVDDAASALVSELNNEISDFIDGKSQDLSKYTSEKIDELKNMLKSKTIVPIRDFTTQTMAKIHGTITDVSSNVESLVDDAFDRIIADIDNCINIETNGTGGELSIEQELLSGLKDIIVNSDYKSQLKKIINSCKEKPEEYLNDIEGKLNGIIGDLETKIDRLFDDDIKARLNKAISNAAEELKTYAGDGLETGKEKLLSALDEKVGSKISDRNININLGSGSAPVVSGSSKNPAGSSNTSSTGGKKGKNVCDYITMTYKDYLYFFLIMGMINGTESELERAAQLMECNIKMRSGDEDFEINKARTMFNVYTASKVKTSVIGRYADSSGFTMKNLSDGYYNIELRSFVGY